MHDIDRRTPLRSIAGSIAVVTLLGGCGSPAAAPVILEPFQGRWAFDSERTYEEMRERGATDEQIEQLREITKALASTGFDVNPDLVFRGNLAIGEGPLESEYRFFGLHQHDGVVCGKAWHHEDRHDPGDMSKCHVRLRVVDHELHLETLMQEEPPSPEDPDLAAEPIVAASADACDAPAGADWSIAVYHR